jgi:hypothetical protein
MGVADNGIDGITRLYIQLLPGIIRDQHGKFGLPYHKSEETGPSFGHGVREFSLNDIRIPDDFRSFFCNDDVFRSEGDLNFGTITRSVDACEMV